MRIIKKLLISLVLTLVITSTINCQKIVAESEKVYNIVLFVEFSDTKHEHIPSAWGKCYKEDPNIEKLWTGTSYPKSLHQYVYNISYGTIDVESIFPQLNNNKIEPYVLENNTSYYAENKDSMIEEAIDALIKSNKINQSQLVDGDGDGCVDNLTLVVPCESGNSNTLFYGLRASFAGSKKVNNKSISNYNIIPESGAYLSMGQSGLIIHEFLHTLGYPDLYRIAGSTVDNPVGLWDIMSSESTRVQFPLAYQRMSVGRYFSIPTVNSNQTSYTLYSATSTMTDSSKKDKQAVIIKTDVSDSEFFVVEYRQKAPQYVNNQYNENAYDGVIYGSGLIIYRVNTSLAKLSNYSESDTPYYIYVFRPNETSNETYGDGKGDIFESYLSSESGRTSYGSNNPLATISDGAITYSDGTNSGIVISNVGSATGDSITFDITINTEASNNYWKAVSTSSQSGAVMDSLMLDGDLYYVLYDVQGNGKLLKYSNETWSELSSLGFGYDYKLTSYNNELYVSYRNSSYKPALSKYSSQGFITLYTSSYDSNDVTITSGSDGVYLGYFVTDGFDTKNLRIYKYNPNGSNELSFNFENSGANPSLFVDDETLYFVYREWTNNNKLKIYKYDNELTEIENNISSSCPYIAINNNKLYTFSSNSTSSVYVKEDESFSKLGNDFLSNAIVEGNILFVDGQPYLSYSYSETNNNSSGIYYFKNSEWKQLGNIVETSNSISSIKGYSNQDDIYVTYLLNKKIVIKKHEADKTNDNKDQKVSYTVKHVIGETVKESKEYTNYVSTSIQNPTILIEDGSLAIKNYDGYELDKISPLCNEGDYVDNNTVITISYKPKAKATLTSAPSGKNLTYTGLDQELIVAGQASGGTIKYSLTPSDEESWSTNIPKGKDAKKYIVYYKVEGDDDHSDLTSDNYKVEVTIAKKTADAISSPTASQITYGDTLSQSTLTQGWSWVDGTVVPTVSNNGYKAETAVTNYDNIDYSSISGYDSTNHKVVRTVSLTVAKANSSATVTAKTGLTYTGSAQALIDSSQTSVTGGTIKYSLTSGGTYSENIPTATNASETITVYYIVVGDSNHNGIEEDSVTTSIAKANSSVTVTAKTGLTFTGEDQTLVTVSNLVGGTIEYKLDDGEYGTSIPKAKAVDTYTVYYKVTGDANHNNLTESSVEVKIDKTAPAYTAPSAITTLKYTGEDQALISAGSTQHGTFKYKLGTDGTYSESIPEATNAGTYTVYYKVIGDSDHSDSQEASVNVTISPTKASVNSPSKNTLTYTGEPQALITAGSATGGSLQYKLGSAGTYSTNIPKAKDAGTYTVYYKVVKDNSGNYIDSDESSIEVTINKAIPVVNAPTAKVLTYNKSNQTLINVGTTSGGIIQYKLSGGTYSTTLPVGKDASTYTIYYKVVGDSNYEDVSEKSINVTIAKADPIVSAPKAINNLSYTGNEQKLITEASTTGGTLLYTLTPSVDSSWSTNIPKGVNAKEYTVYYKVTGDNNYNNVAQSSIKVSIAKANISGLVSAKSNLTYTGSPIELVTNTVSGGTVYYKNGSDWSTTIPSKTDVGTYSVTYKITGDSNHNNVLETTINNINIAKASSVLTKAPTAKTNLTYTGQAQSLINGGSASGGTLQYTLTPTVNNSWLSTIPSATKAGKYTVYYRVKGDSNHNDLTSDNYKVDVNSAKATPSYSIPSGLVANKGDLLSSVALTTGWKWNSPNTTIDSVGVKSYKATFTPNDTDNYNAVEIDLSITVSEAKATINIDSTNIKAGSVVYINGQPVKASKDNTVDDNGKTNIITTYTIKNSESNDVHTQYPTSMKVYIVEQQQDGSKKAVHYSDFDDILTYAGASIRVTGTKGIRIITSIPTAKKNKLIKENISNYIAVEYGTVMCWADTLGENEEPSLYYDSTSGTYKAKQGAKGRAYSRKDNINTYYSESNGTTKYTNTLVDTKNAWDNASCSKDFAMRSYLIIRPKDAKDSSKDIVVYGGTLYRSISYVAYQNKNAFKPKTNAYEYIWTLIRNGYGNQYDSEYKES